MKELSSQSDIKAGLRRKFGLDPVLLNKVIDPTNSQHPEEREILIPMYRGRFHFHITVRDHMMMDKEGT